MWFSCNPKPQTRTRRPTKRAFIERYLMRIFFGREIPWLLHNKDEGNLELYEKSFHP